MYKKSFHPSADLIENATFMITGGAGFIGSHLVEYLLNFNAGKVIAVDNLITGRKRNIKPFLNMDNFEFWQEDLRDKDLCYQLCEEVDYILHQAALGSVPRSIKNPILTNEINVDSTLNLLDAAYQAGVTRMIAASSSSVYGDDNTLPKRENQVGRPLSPYAVSKRTVEYYTRVFKDLYGLETVLLRYFNVFGPRQDPEGPYAAVIPRFIKACLKDQPISIHGDGQQTRDFTFVENVVQANIKALFAPKDILDDQSVFNVAVGENYSINHLVHLIEELMNYSPEINYESPRTGDIKNSLADISAIQQKLDYHPTVHFKEGLSQTIAYFKDSITVEK